RTTHELNEPVRDHLLLFGVPLLALSVDVDPHAQPFILGEDTIGDLRWQSPILVLLLNLNEDLRVGPAAIPIDDAELAGQIRVRLDEKRLEDPFIRLDLPL